MIENQKTTRAKYSFKEIVIEPKQSIDNRDTFETVYSIY